MNKALPRAVVLGVVAFFAASLMSCAKPKEEETAIQWAESWLALVDQEKYQESWEGLSGLFKENVGKPEWINDLNGFRKPLGRVLERKLQHETESSEGGIGEYVIFQYDTSFEHKKSVVEAVSVIKDKNGRWGTLGYSIH